MFCLSCVHALPVRLSHTTRRKQKTKTMENLIGKKIRGFKFKDTEGITYLTCMDKHIGEIGVIKYFRETDETFMIQFKDDYWYYPLSEIKNHLVEEFERGEVVEVSDDNNEWESRIFLTEIKGAVSQFACVVRAHEERFKDNKPFTLSMWKHIRKVKRKYFSYEHKNGEVLIFQQESEDENSFDSIEQIIRQLKSEGVTEKQFTVNKK